MKLNKYVKNFTDHWFLLTELVKKGINLKYRRSYLGILWSLIEPILTTIVLVIVFGTLFNRKNPDFPLYILSGRLLFSFFSTSTKASCRSIFKNRSMIKKVYVPKYMYPLSDILFNFVIFIISLLVFIPVSIYCHTYPNLTTIWQIFPALVFLLAICIGLGFVLSTVNVFFRDIEYLWNVGTLIIMYMSAIFYYPERLLASGYAWILRLNPLWCIIDMFRGGFLGYVVDSWHFLYAGCFAAVAMLVGLIVFKAEQDKFVLNI